MKSAGNVQMIVIMTYKNYWWRMFLRAFGIKRRADEARVKIINT